MIYRIDYRHFLTHMIDYFTREQIISFKYLVLSSRLNITGVVTNAVSVSELFPPPEIIESYINTGDEDMLRRQLINFYSGGKRRSSAYAINNCIINTIMDPLLNHHNIIIICHEEENIYVDIFAEYIEDAYGCTVINLNELFINGYMTHNILYDIGNIKQCTKDMMKSIKREEDNNKIRTEDGRRDMASDMSKEKKIKILKKMGITIDDNNVNKLESIFDEVWVKSDK